MKINKGTAPHCVQCLEPMLYGTDSEKFVPICNNPACPNFGLLQMGIEKMEALSKESKSIQRRKKVMRGGKR